MTNAYSFLRSAAVALCLFAGGSLTASAGDLAGKVSRMEGAAAVLRNGEKVELIIGSVVYTEDQLSTGDAARLEIVLRDETLLTLGANADIVIDAFVFDPEASKGTALLTVVEGAFRFTTGKLSGMTEKRIEVKTEFANLAVRGTDFWGGALDGGYGVMVLKGKVEVATPKGKVLVDQPMHGTDIPAIGAAPSAPKAWPADKRDRALAQVNFKG